MYFIVVFIVFHIWKVTKNGLQTKDLSIPRVYIFCSEYSLQFHMCLWVKNDKRGESLQIVLVVVVGFFRCFFTTSNSNFTFPFTIKKLLHLLFMRVVFVDIQSCWFKKLKNWRQKWRTNRRSNTWFDDR